MNSSSGVAGSNTTNIDIPKLPKLLACVVLQGASDK